MVDGHALKVRKSIAIKFIIYILLFSSITTAAITAMQLYMDYVEGIKAIEGTMELIEQIYTGSLSDSIWTFNHKQIDLQLKGILKLHDIVYAEVKSGKDVVIAAGEKLEKHKKEKIILLNYKFNDQEIHLGILTVVATLKGLYSRIWDKLIFTLLGQAGKTFFVSLFIFYIFYTLVAKHLHKISDYLKDITSDNMGEQLDLDRKTHETHIDELDIVVDSVNIRMNAINKELSDKAQNLEMLNRKLAEQYEILQVAKKESDKANKAKSKFLSNMSHEIRTPLNVVLGYAQILEQDSSLNITQKKSVKTIQTAGSHLLSLINDVLDLSKIEAGAMSLELSSFNLNSLIESVETMFKVRCEQRGLEWRVKKEYEGKNFVYADQVKIRQILINILGNAVKFTDHGSVSFQVKQSGYNFNFVIQDTGSGISTESLNKIFDPFHQEEMGVQKGGTGLGLAIAKKQIELMGGTLEVKSKEGKGTTFLFTIYVEPAKKRITTTKKYKKTITGIEGNKKILALVVDDIQENLDLLASILERIGVGVYCAHHGKEALELMSRYDFDIAYIDIKMPVMNGEETILAIREQYKDSKIKCVAISAFSLLHEVQHYLQIGFDKYITKPFRFDEIYDSLETFLGVQFIYDECQKTTTQNEKQSTELHDFSNITLVKSTYNKLKQAAQFNNITEIQDIVNEIKIKDEVPIGFIQYMEELLSRYDTKTILQILDQISIRD